jgi:general secretion pathway protein D
MPIVKNSTMSTTQRFAALPLSIALILSGCESLAPEAIKRPPIPANLRIESLHNKPLDARPIQSEPLGSKPIQPPEFYPASGNLLGRGGATVGAAPATATRGHREGKYTLNFDDADLNEVAKTILDETLKLNYVISPKVSGRVTLQTTRALTDDELIPTLETLLRLNGAVLIKDASGIYRIEPEASGQAGIPGARMGLPGQRIPTGYQLRVVPLRYVGVTEMQKILEPLMPAKSIVKADTNRNMLWLAGSGENLSSVLETIQLFDVDFMRGMSVGIFPLSNVEPALVATEIEKILGDTAKGPLAGLLRVMPIDRLNAIMAITPQPRYLEEIASWVGRLDRYNPHRMGSIHVYRLQNVDATELAKTLSNIFGGGSGSGSRASLRPGFQDSNIGASSATTPGAGGSGFSSSAGDLGSSTSGDLGMGSSSGSLGSTMGPNSMGGSSGSMGGSSGGLGGSSSSGLGGSSGGLGGTGGSGGFGGGIGRGTSGSRTQGSTATNLGNVRIVADPPNNALIITAKAQEYKEIEAVIKELDVLPLQVLIDATIAEVELTDDLKYGIKWYFQQGSMAESLGKPLADYAEKAAIAGASATGFSYVLAGKDLRVLLTAEAVKGKVNMLSSPSVMVLNNQEASMRVGDQVPILTGSVSNTINTNNVVQAIQYRDTGVLLNVRPRVNSGGLVNMDIIQTVSNVKPKPTTGSDSATEINSPTIAQRQIKSTVAVQDGDTLVLGGLIRENTANTKTGIPLLYELPIIGDLFGSTNMASTRSELVVLLTPRIVDSQIKGREISNEFRRKLTGLYDPGPSNINIGNGNFTP